MNDGLTNLMIGGETMLQQSVFSFDSSTDEIFLVANYGTNANIPVIGAVIIRGENIRSTNVTLFEFQTHIESNADCLNGYQSKTRL